MSFRSVLRAATVTAGGLLVGFHGWLFAGQIAAGRLEDPWLVFRWVAAAALVLALVAIRSRGTSVWSRQGIAVWVLAALLHGPAVAGQFGDEFNSIALPSAVASSVLQLVSSAALAISVWMLAGLLAARDRRFRRDSRFAFAFSSVPTPAPDYSPPFSPRPPPYES